MPQRTKIGKSAAFLAALYITLFAACATGNTNLSDRRDIPKTLVINNISQTFANELAALGDLIFVIGDTSTDVTIASSNASLDPWALAGGSPPFTLTISLYAWPAVTNRWTGSGFYAVGILPLSESVTYGYTVYNVEFASATTTIDAGRFHREYK